MSLFLCMYQKPAYRPPAGNSHNKRRSIQPDCLERTREIRWPTVQPGTCLEQELESVFELFLLSTR